MKDPALSYGETYNEQSIRSTRETYKARLRRIEKEIDQVSGDTSALLREAQRIRQILKAG